MDTLVAELEQISARAWPPVELGWVAGWRLHAANGYAGRSNCCWPTLAPDRPIDEAIQAVEAWYVGRGLPPLFKPADSPSSTALIAALTARAYRPRSETLVMQGPLPDVPVGLATIADAPDDGFTGLFSDFEDVPADAAERLATLRRIARPRAFASVQIDGRTVAIGAAAIEGDWAGIFGMRTAAGFQRRGLAQAVIGALWAAARSEGAGCSYLQVTADNVGAIALYERLGYREAYRYRYWDRR